MTYKVGLTIVCYGVVMIALLKGIIAGIIGTAIVSLLVQRVSDSNGGALSIHVLDIAGHQVHWSWPLFLVLTGFATALFKMME